MYGSTDQTNLRSVLVLSINFGTRLCLIHPGESSIGKNKKLNLIKEKVMNFSQVNVCLIFMADRHMTNVVAPLFWK